MKEKWAMKRTFEMDIWLFSSLFSFAKNKGCHIKKTKQNKKNLTESSKWSFEDFEPVFF